MKAAISKEQAQEIRRWLEKQRVPKDTVDLLLSSQNASNTYKAFRMKRQITTTDGWVVHFGANWAREVEKADDSDSDKKAAESSAAKSDSPPAKKAKQEPAKKNIKTIGEDFLSRTFMGLAEKLKRLQIEDVDKPPMQKIAFEVDKDHLAILKKIAVEKNSSVGNLIRIAIRDFIE